MATLGTSALPPPCYPSDSVFLFDFLAYRHPSISCSAGSPRHGGGGRRPADGTSAHPSNRGRHGRSAGAPCCRRLRWRVSHGGPTLDAPSGPYAFSSDGERLGRWGKKGNEEKFREALRPMPINRLLSWRDAMKTILFFSSCPSPPRAWLSLVRDSGPTACGPTKYRDNALVFTPPPSQVSILHIRCLVCLLRHTCKTMTGGRGQQEIEGRYQEIIGDFDKIDQQLVKKVGDFQSCDVSLRQNNAKRGLRHLFPHASGSAQGVVQVTPSLC